MCRIFSCCLRVALIPFVANIAWSQANPDNIPGLNVNRDSAGQIVVNKSSAPQTGSSLAPAMGQASLATEALGPAKKQYGPVEVLNDTHGVDVGPYVLNQVLPAIRDRWYASIPSSAQMKKGAVVIAFAIEKDGKVAGMKLVRSSGEVALDRAAWAGIMNSGPFPSFPAEFTISYLNVRFRFFYNPDKAELAEAPPIAHASAPIIVHAKPMTSDAGSRLPKYPKQARKQKTEGVVRLNVDIGPDGKVKDLKVLDGDPLLADTAVRAARKWRFYAAEKGGRPLEEWATIRFDFVLDIDQVRANIESYSEDSPSR